LLDFRQANPRDIRWWRRSNLIIQAMMDDDERSITRAEFDYQTSFFGNGQLTEDGFKDSQTAAKDIFSTMCQQLRPWQAKNAAAEDEITSLVETYKRVIGDPNDPEFMAKINAEVEEWHRLQKLRIVTETDDERIARLTLENDKKLGQKKREGQHRTRSRRRRP
jgi:hypothetical protein